MTLYVVEDDWGAGYLREVHAVSEEQAAGKWAQDTFSDRDYNRTAACVVTDPNGVQSHWAIETDNEPVFRAARIQKAEG